jgi:2-hydroxychromene-2-carboxylate isomerase
VAQPRFYYDLASPDAYLAAERVMHVLPEIPEWIPVRLGGLAAGGVGAFRCAEEEDIYRADVEERARRYELQPVRWPDPFPADTAWAMLAATYSKQIGRGVAFSLAAFRQAFAGGRDLGIPDNVAIAAAACELHPNAIAKAAASGSVKGRLREETDRAGDRGVFGVPTVVVGEEVFWGDDRLEEAVVAAAALPGTTAAG